MASTKDLTTSTKTLMHEHSSTIKNQGNLLQTQDALFQRHSPSWRALENQVGQIAMALHFRPQESFPSDTKINKHHGNEKCSVLTLRSGGHINQNDKFGGKQLEDSSQGITQPEDRAEVVEYDRLSKEKENDEGSENHQTYNGKLIAKGSISSAPTVNDVGPPPPFPQRLKKHNDKIQFRKFVDRKFENVAATTEICSAVRKLLQKQKDPGSFVIPCSIGDNFVGRALVGLGIEDAIVKVDKFVYPVDFLLLDCEADENAPIILG
ncbi:uncharacterized protein LOC120177568 [Hibiscus syriacus]|uniref:uncharacterized protein LOC120177568 n=1 Tax=Hibiscus syriacus TaxID=106335 RepID=UPI0019204F87|nr:uncharacterized protein LOC120177568 [Hibiscus syriacus]